MSRLRSWLLFVLLAALLAAFSVTVYLALPKGSNELLVAFLDVGQGDAIYVRGPNGTDLLIDGGRDDSVLRELPSAAGWFDRTIDVLIATHPDADHVSGLADVLARYEVGALLESGNDKESPATRALSEAAANEPGLTQSLARSGTVIDLGGGAYAEVLFPDRDVAGVESNTASIILRVVYGETAFLLTGDSPEAVETYLAAKAPDSLRATVLKAGHHGSRTSSSPRFVRAVAPQYAVVSAGKDNDYGHPHREVLDIFAAEGVAVLHTMGEGGVYFRSDGETLRVSEGFWRDLASLFR